MTHRDGVRTAILAITQRKPLNDKQIKCHGTSMSAAGLPEPRSEHAQAAIEMAIAMQRYLETVRAEHPEMRLPVGIHTCPAVAGVIGESKIPPRGA
jgi:class 3 adenylate cyclase